MLKAATAARLAWDAFLRRRILSDLAVIAMLMLLAGLLAGALLLFICYGCLRLLVHVGMSPDMALLAVAGGLALLMGLVAWAAVRRLRRLQDMLHPLKPVTSSIGDIADAFMDGLKGR